jgi:hypothetical protein
MKEEEKNTNKSPKVGKQQKTHQQQEQNRTEPEMWRRRLGEMNGARSMCLTGCFCSRR